MKFILANFLYDEMHILRDKHSYLFYAKYTKVWVFLFSLNLNPQIFGHSVIVYVTELSHSNLRNAYFQACLQYIKS